MTDIDTSRYTITESGNVIRSICRGERMTDIDTSRYTITESGNVIRSICRGERMTVLEEIKQKADE